MKKTLLLTLFLFICFFITNAQPDDYVPGTQVCWQFNGRDHGYFKAAGNGERHILLSFTGDGETGCNINNNFQARAPQSFLKDDGTNEWDGRTVRAPGDTIAWEILTIAHTSANWMGAYASDIDYFFTNIASFDPNEKWRYHIAGLSGGVGRMWGYLTNSQGHNSPYRNIFSTTISLSGVKPGEEVFDDLPAASADKRNWVWCGTNDGGNTSLANNQAVYDQLAGHKRFTWQDGAGHGDDAWDSCWSLKGVDSNYNRWLWMVRQDAPPPQECSYTGGPANYVEGTSVCWTFNGRSHGYYRAPGCGERHVLIMFTGELPNNNCTDYATNAPEKWLGSTWDGRTLRGAGDSIKWEILTIENTSSYYLPEYASDINYFFQNIDTIDTADHRLFHAAGLSDGVGRMWGYLVNAQSHNSPYRDIFSSTISMSVQWIGMTGIPEYSVGRRHWVWHGTADADGNTPPAASNALYAALNGAKRQTAQSGGTHGANTWDSCMSVNGTDSNSNRWIWMATNPGGSSRGPWMTDIIGQPDEKELLVSVFPNPGQDKVVIRFNQAPLNTYRLTVTDMNGRVCKIISGNQSVHVLDISALAKGMYILQIDNNGIKTEKKLVRQ